MSVETKKILVPVGFSEQSLIALDEACILASAMGSEIVLLSVIEDNDLITRVFGSDESRNSEKVKEQIQSRLLLLAEEKFRETGIKISTMLAHGTIYEEIARVAELIDASLVVMGTNGRPSNFKKRLIGSNAYRTVGNTKIPVITTRGIRRLSGLKNIIFPLVLDRRSKEKVGMALYFSRLFNSKITVVAVPKKADDVLILQKHLNQVVNFINERGVLVEGHILEPKAGKSIEEFLDFAYNQDGDLIMQMEENESVDIASNLLGSDMQEVIYHSEVPVMSLTPKHQRYESLFQNW